MIDMHCHILPATDDGAKDIEISMEMLQIAARNGTKAIVATPHVIEGAWLPSWDEIQQKCHDMQLAARQAGLPITLYPGAEVAIHLDMLKLLTKPGPYCINGGKYILVELPAAEIPHYTEDFFFTLQARGITPILAHPERHPLIIKKPELLLEWVGKGILVQMNAPSLTGKMGVPVMHTAELLLRSSLVHVIGSDAHSTRTRNPNLQEASAKIGDIASAVSHHELLFDNPSTILASSELKLKDSVQLARRAEKGRSSWLQKLNKLFR